MKRMIKPLARWCKKNPEEALCHAALLLTSAFTITSLELYGDAIYRFFYPVVPTSHHQDVSGWIVGGVIMAAFYGACRLECTIIHKLFNKKP